MRIGAFLFLTMLAVASAATQSPGAAPVLQVNPQPAPSTVPSKYDDVALRRDNSAAQVDVKTDAGAKGTSDAQPPTAVVTNGFEPKRVLMALGTVIVLILGLRIVGKRLFASAAAPKSNGAMRVVSRLVIAPKQQLLLIQIGKRLVVTADCGTQMSSLAEISDPDEIASLLGSITAEAKQSPVRKFGLIFGRAREDFEAPAPEKPERIVAADSPANVPADIASIEETRTEISGLMNKIKVLSDQFRRST